MKIYSWSHVLERLRQDSPARFLERLSTTVRVNLRELAWDSYLGFLRLFYRDGFCLRPVQGGKMYLDLRDKGITRELFFKGIREIEATRYMQETMKPGQVIYDVGANIGYYVIMEAALVGPSGRIIGVEPVPSNFRLLTRNVEANGLKNVELTECAIGDVEGTAEMFVTDKSNWSSMHKFAHAVVTSKISVKTFTLDQFAAGRPAPDFVRMDVEGYETNIVRGMKGILASGRPLKMFIEIHPHIMKRESLLEMLQTLAAAGFRVEKFFDNVPFQGDRIEDLIRQENFMNGKFGSALAFFCRP